MYFLPSPPTHIRLLQTADILMFLCSILHTIAHKHTAYLLSYTKELFLSTAERYGTVMIIITFRDDDDDDTLCHQVLLSAVTTKT